MIPYQSVHFIGVLTPEMASLASYVAKLKIRVSGSAETNQSQYIDTLRSLGVTLFEMFSQLNIGKHVELVVLSRYYDMRHVEADAALKLKIPVISETDFLRLLSEGKERIVLLGNYESRLAATFLSIIFASGGIPAQSLTTTVFHDPTFINLAQPSESDWFILPLTGFKRDASTYEADFLSFEVKVAGIPNLRYDYPELNTTLDDIYLSYYAFAKRIPRKGLIVGNGDYSRMKRLQGHLADRHIETYGEGRDTSWQYTDLEHTDRGIRFYLKHNRESYGPFEIPPYNKAAVSAATTAIIIALYQDISHEVISTALGKLPQLRRFCDTQMDQEGRIIVDDQGDHPELIQDTLESVRKRFPSKKIWCLYQAGSYLRMKVLFSEIGHALSKADFVYITSVSGYPREKTEGVDIRQLVTEMKHFHPQTYYFDENTDLSKLLSHRVTSTDCIVTLGVEGICQRTIAPLMDPNPS
jgi:UDP-N-acetylmuramate--alanine ligase